MVFRACPDALMPFSWAIKNFWAFVSRSIAVKKAFEFPNLALIAGSTSLATLKYSLVF